MALTCAASHTVVTAADNDDDADYAMIVKEDEYGGGSGIQTS